MLRLSEFVNRRFAMACQIKLQQFPNQTPERWVVTVRLVGRCKALAAQVCAY